MPTIKIDLGSDCTGLTLTMYGKYAASDYYILAADGSSEPYNSEHEADYQHAGTEPERPGEYSFLISDNIEADEPIIFRVEDEEGNKWAEEVLMYDGEVWHDLATDSAAARAAAEAVEALVEAGGAGDLAAIKTQTDKFSFTGTDVKATLDGEVELPSSIPSGWLAAILTGKATSVVITTYLVTAGELVIEYNHDYPSSKSRAITFVNNGSFGDLTGSTPHLIIRSKGSNDIIIDSVGTINGSVDDPDSIEFDLTSEETGLLTNFSSKAYQYKVELRYTDGVVCGLIQENDCTVLW